MFTCITGKGTLPLIAPEYIPSVFNTYRLSLPFSEAVVQVLLPECLSLCRWGSLAVLAWFQTLPFPGHFWLWKRAGNQTMPDLEKNGSEPSGMRWGTIGWLLAGALVVFFNYTSWRHFWKRTRFRKWQEQWYKCIQNKGSTMRAINGNVSCTVINAFYSNSHYTFPSSFVDCCKKVVNVTRHINFILNGILNICIFPFS